MNRGNLSTSTIDKIGNIAYTGDIVAFRGKGFVSWIIRMVTRCPISHVGIVYKEKPFSRPKLVESTSLNGANGVQVRDLEKAVEEYNGSVYILPLLEFHCMKVQYIRQSLNAIVQTDSEYDTVQAVLSAIDFNPGDNDSRFSLFNRQSYKRLFCSELVASVLKDVGILSQYVNASEITPADLVKMDIYCQRYYQFKGEAAEIPGYNSVKTERGGYKELPVTPPPS